MVYNTRNLLTISSWNTNCLEFKANGEKTNMLHDPEVINVLNKSNFIGLMEIHAGPAASNSVDTMCIVKIDLNTKKHGNHQGE